MAPGKGYTLKVLGGRYAVCRLQDDEGPEAFPKPDGFWAVLRTTAGWTLVCPEGETPVSAEIEPGWRVLKVGGPLPFNLIGVLADLLRPLKEAEVSVFVLSSYETDFILVKEDDLEAAMKALRAARYQIRS